MWQRDYLPSEGPSKGSTSPNPFAAPSPRDPSRENIVRARFHSERSLPVNSNNLADR